MFEKHPRIRIQKHLDAANGLSCVRCTREDGTVVFAHYSGLYSHRFGKGTANKVHDICGADLCMECHGYFDHYKAGNDADRAAEFMSYCFATLARRFEKRQMGWIGK